MSLNNIIDDIIQEARNNQVAESELLSRNQVALWVNNYRALLIKQQMDKGYDIDENLLTTIAPFHLTKDTNQVRGKVEYISDNEIPNLITSNYGQGVLSVKDMFGNLIQLGDETKAKYQTSRKYTCADYIAYIKNNHLYLSGPGNLEYVEISGILEDPTSIGDLGIGQCFDADGDYPINANMVPVIKQMIFANEFQMMLRVGSDETNNSDPDTVNSAVYAANSRYQSRGSNPAT
jgi:hypothetical protein